MNPRTEFDLPLTSSASREARIDLHPQNNLRGLHGWIVRVSVAALRARGRGDFTDAFWICSFSRSFRARRASRCTISTGSPRQRPAIMCCAWSWARGMRAWGASWTRLSARAIASARVPKGSRQTGRRWRCCESAAIIDHPAGEKRAGPKQEEMDSD